jgi:Fe-S-cluster containining protein
MDFPCDSCGLCCRHVDRNDITKVMCRGDGVCIHLDEASSTCTIYATRPAFCRIDDSYVFWSDSMSLIEYHKANADVCNSLRVEHASTDHQPITI